MSAAWVGIVWFICGCPRDVRSRRGRIFCWLIRVEPDRVAAQIEKVRPEYPSMKRRQ